MTGSKKACCHEFKSSVSRRRSCAMSAGQRAGDKRNGGRRLRRAGVGPLCSTPPRAVTDRACPAGVHRRDQRDERPRGGVEQPRGRVGPVRAVHRAGGGGGRGGGRGRGGRLRNGARTAAAAGTARRAPPSSGPAKLWFRAGGGVEGGFARGLGRAAAADGFPPRPAPYLIVQLNLLDCNSNARVHQIS